MNGRYNVFLVVKALITVLECFKALKYFKLMSNPTQKYKTQIISKCEIYCKHSYYKYFVEKIKFYSFYLNLSLLASYRKDVKGVPRNMTVARRLKSRR